MSALDVGEASSSSSQKPPLQPSLPKHYHTNQYYVVHTEKVKNLLLSCRSYITSEINYCLIVTIFTFYFFFPFTYHYSWNHIQYLNPGIMINFFSISALVQLSLPCLGGVF